MIWLAGLPVIWWVAILLADAIQPGRNLFELMEVLTEKLNHPFQFHYTEYTIKSMLVCTLLYAAGIGIFYSSQKNYRRGEEHGSARWGDARQICKKYSQKPYSQNILLTQNFRISLDTHKHRRCLNILVVGGSGAGKSRGFALPNIMQCCCSMVITDPKAELLRKTGGLLEKKGYEVRVFDLINPDTSFCYNPFEYVHDDKDVLRLISNLIQNTTPKGSQSSDPFWEKSETALLQALMLYLLHEAPPEEQPVQPSEEYKEMYHSMEDNIKDEEPSLYYTYFRMRNASDQPLYIAARVRRNPYGFFYYLKPKEQATHWCCIENCAGLNFDMDQVLIKDLNKGLDYLEIYYRNDKAGTLGPEKDTAMLYNFIKPMTEEMVGTPRDPARWEYEEFPDRPRAVRWTIHITNEDYEEAVRATTERWKDWDRWSGEPIEWE